MAMLDSLMMLVYLFARPHGEHAPKPLLLKSTAFRNHHNLPKRYTCYGKGQPVPLSWRNLPKETRSVAILMTDKDMPRQQHFYHWAIFNIPPQVNKLPQTKNTASFANNSWGKHSYQPPCPKHGVHHYEISFYALDTILPPSADKSAVAMREQMRHHVLASAKITTKFKGQ